MVLFEYDARGRKVAESQPTYDPPRASYSLARARRAGPPREKTVDQSNGARPSSTRTPIPDSTPRYFCLASRAPLSEAWTVQGRLVTGGGALMGSSAATATTLAGTCPDAGRRRKPDPRCGTMTGAGKTLRGSSRPRHRHLPQRRLGQAWPRGRPRHQRRGAFRPPRAPHRALREGKPWRRSGCRSQPPRRPRLRARREPRASTATAGASEYDAFGRPERTVTFNDGLALSVGPYDARFGRVKAVGYPNGRMGPWSTPTTGCPATERAPCVGQLASRGHLVARTAAMTAHGQARTE